MRSNSSSARPGAPDQCEDASVQTANSASAPAPTDIPALHPSHGCRASVIRSSSATSAAIAATAVVPAKKPPALKHSAAVAAAGAASRACRATALQVLGDPILDIRNQESAGSFVSVSGMSQNDDLQPDLQPVIDMLHAHRPEATALELDAVKQQVRARVANPARRRTRGNQLMKSRLVILTMLVLGMLLSTTGAGLAVSGLSGKNASIAQYSTSTPTGGVLGDQDTGSGTSPEENGGGGTAPDTDTNTQPARQVEAGANNSSLPFTGFAAIPVLLGGIALLSAGLVLRRRTGDER